MTDEEFGIINQCMRRNRRGMERKCKYCKRFSKCSDRAKHILTHFIPKKDAVLKSAVREVVEYMDKLPFLCGQPYAPDTPKRRLRNLIDGVKDKRGKLIPEKTNKRND